ncbi:related to conserved hypothetical Ustilaginaceae-specific protein [Ustilago trichophora]|uniref:Related to conserved hypothetical Ustilaginaceae-specific protein n=1 Tax=Ustilago trichophora TaxID=86804 RepID=A0A5C3E6R7_9BASI|nr:related to conserved hypothetical Ustilaginaceae-specific protein [Ustilago trichophora]
MNRRIKPWTFMAFALESAILLQVLPSAMSIKMPPNDGPGPQVVHDFSHSSPSWHLLKQEPSDSCDPTPLYVDPEAYKERCKPSKGPCFGHVGASLIGTQISPWFEPLNMTDEVVLADDSAQSFAVQDATVAFEITYMQFDQLKLRYSNYDPATRCFDIQLSRNKKPKFRMSIGETSDLRDLDTLHGRETSTRFCSESLMINIRSL